jgi:hypothetical protein
VTTRGNRRVHEYMSPVWVGLFDDGDPHRNYITYNFLAGKVSGTTTFPKGLRKEGAYEARPLFKDSYKLEAFFDFTVLEPE